MTVMQNQGLISLLPKKNNGLGNLNNWRPLTLLNTDYKIVQKKFQKELKNTYLISQKIHKLVSLREDILERIFDSYRKQ